MAAIRVLLKTVGIALATFVVVAGVALAWMKLAPRRVPDGQPPLATLGADSLGAFREAFNSGQERLRVLALLSPT